MFIGFRLNWLPVVEDVDESPYVYGYLCDLIEGNHPMILGPNNANIPRIIGIFAEAYSVEALPATNEVHKRMVNITRQVQVTWCFQLVDFVKSKYIKRNIKTFKQLAASNYIFIFQGNAQVFDACVAGLTPTQQQGLQTALAAAPTS